MSKRGYLSAFSRSLKKILVGIADLVRKFQTILRILVLLSGLGAFSVIGGLLFQVVESPREQLSIAVTKEIRDKTLESIYTIFARVKAPSRRERNDYNILIVEYRESYVKAIKNGTTFVNGKPNPLWTFEGSTYFCVTTFAQLGFGNLAPKSVLGRFVSILYACFSIPFGAIVFADLGDQINNLITVSYSVFFQFFKTLKEAADEDIEKYEKLKMGMKMLTKKAKKKAEQKEKEKRGLLKAVRRLANLNQKLRKGGAGVVGVNPEGVQEEVVENYDSNKNHNYNDEGSSELNEFSPGCRIHISRILPKSRKHSNVLSQISWTDLRSNEPSDYSYSISLISNHQLQYRKKCYNPNTISILMVLDHTSTITHHKPIQTEKAENGNVPSITIANSNDHRQPQPCNYPKTPRTTNKNNSMFTKMHEILTLSPACPLFIRLALFKQIVSNKLKLKKRVSSIGNMRKRSDIISKPKGLHENEFNNSNIGGGGDDSDDEEEDDEDEGSDIMDDMAGEQMGVVIISILLVVVYVIIGIYIITIHENWNYTDAAWFLIMSVLTVGYGDITPRDERFFAFFIGYLIIGMAIVSNLISMSMKFLTTVTSQLSSIAKDMYITTNTRSKFHSIRKNGLRARRWWLVVRHHVMSGLPKSLTDESRARKNRLIETEKNLIKRAFRIYYQKQMEDELQKLTGAEEPGVTVKYVKCTDNGKIERSSGLSGPGGPSGLSGLGGPIGHSGKEIIIQQKYYYRSIPKEDKATQTEWMTLWQRVKRGTKNKYQKFRNAMAPGADYF